MPSLRQPKGTRRLSSETPSRSVAVTPAIGARGHGRVDCRPASRRRRHIGGSRGRLPARKTARGSNSADRSDAGTPAGAGNRRFSARLLPYAPMFLRAARWSAGLPLTPSFPAVAGGQVSTATRCGTRWTGPRPRHGNSAHRDVASRPQPKNGGPISRGHKGPFFSCHFQSWRDSAGCYPLGRAGRQCQNAHCSA